MEKRVPTTPKAGGGRSCVEQAADLAGELIEHNPYIDRIDIMLVRP